MVCFSKGKRVHAWVGGRGGEELDVGRSHKIYLGLWRPDSSNLRKEGWR